MTRRSNKRWCPSNKLWPSLTGGLSGVAGSTSPLRARKARQGRVGQPQRPKTSEAQVLRSCLDLLQHHPKVAMVWRANTGTMRIASRYVKFGFPGQSDILGVMKGSGKLLAVEVKAPGKWPTDDQYAFLTAVQGAGGLSFWTDDAAKLARWLEMHVVQVNAQLQWEVYRDPVSGRWIAVCKPLAITLEADTHTELRGNIEDTMRLFMRSTFEGDTTEMSSYNCDSTVAQSGSAPGS